MPCRSRLTPFLYTSDTTPDTMKPGFREVSCVPSFTTGETEIGPKTGNHLGGVIALGFGELQHAVLQHVDNEEVLCSGLIWE